VDEQPPGLTASGGGEEPPAEPGRRGARRSLLLPVLVGIVLGGAAIAAAAVFLRDDTGDPAPAPAATQPATEPPPEILRIVFPEGFTREAMAQRITEVNEIAAERRGLTPALTARDYLRATRRANLQEARAKLPSGFSADRKVRSFEGFLFPATYDFTEATVSPELVDQQLEKFAEEWAKLDLAFARSKNLTPYDVLIVASMIEGEVQVPRERALVAAVIYNRLRLGMPLGIDATLRYGLEIPATRPIRQSELEDPTPYNTRVHKGLPPTPINNPGLAALEAAAHPAEVDFLYFVRKRDCKSHFFTASEEEFLRRLDQPRC